MRRGPKELWLYLWISGVGINPNLVSISIYERFRGKGSIISYLNVLNLIAAIVLILVQTFMASYLKAFHVCVC